MPCCVDLGDLYFILVSADPLIGPLGYWSSGSQCSHPLGASARMTLFWASPELFSSGVSSGSCLSSLAGGLLLMTTRASCLQVAEVVVVSCDDVVNIGRFRLTVGISQLTDPFISSKNLPSEQVPVRRQPPLAVAGVPSHLTPIGRMCPGWTHPTRRRLPGWQPPTRKRPASEGRPRGATAETVAVSFGRKSVASLPPYSLTIVVGVNFQIRAENTIECDEVHSIRGFSCDFSAPEGVHRPYYSYKTPGALSRTGLRAGVRVASPGYPRGYPSKGSLTKGTLLEHSYEPGGQVRVT